MLLLLGAAITASFFDSLNPSAIAEQILLQTMVRNKRHILFFIAGIGFANLAMGLAIYYGAANWASQAYSAITAAYPLYVYGAETSAGLLFLGLGIRLIVKTSRSQNSGGKEERAAPKPPAQLAPLPLFFDGCRLLLRGVDQRPAVFWILGSASELSVDISVSLRFLSCCIILFIFCRCSCSTGDTAGFREQRQFSGWKVFSVKSHCILFPAL